MTGRPIPSTTYDTGIAQCTKRIVTVTIYSPNGRRYVATNHVRAVPSTGCPRAAMPSGTGWHLCKEVCGQQAHAEVNALALAGDHARGATLYIVGHDYVCDDCKAAAVAAGIARIVIIQDQGERR